MTLIPPTPNPLQTFANTNLIPAMSINGLVLDQVYALTGIVDRVQPSTGARYPNPSLGLGRPTQQPFILPKATVPDPNGWTTPTGLGGSPGLITVQVTLSFQTYLNHIEFDLLNVPCNWSVWYEDPHSGTLLQLTDSVGNPVGGVIVGSTSVVSQINSGALPSEIQNGFNHFDLDLTLVSCSVLQIQLDRDIPANLLPREFVQTFQQTNYPLGIRKLSMSLTSTDWNEVPPWDATVTRTTPLGFTEQIDVLSYVGNNAVQNGTGWGGDGSWKSSPMPVGDAVVPYYLDVRDQDGNPVLLDGMYLDPLYSGMKMNMYYTIDDTVAPFLCSLNVLNPENTAFPNVYLIPATQTQMNFGQKTFPNNFGQEAYLQLGITWYPPATLPAPSSTVYPLVGFGYNGHDLVGEDGIYLRNVSGTPVVGIGSLSGGGVEVPVDWTKPISIVAFGQFNDPDVPPHLSYGLSMRLMINNGTPSDVEDMVGIAAPWDFFIDNNFGSVDFFWVKQFPGNTSFSEDPWVPLPLRTIATAYLANPRGFVEAKGPPSSTRGDWYAICLAMQIPVAQGNNGFSGYAGPGKGYNDNKSWTPVPRQFNVQKGMYVLPPIYASFIKLEFTNLTKQPYLLSEPVKRTFYTFPTEIESYFQNLESQIPDITTSPYAALNASTTSPQRFNTVLPTTTMFGASNIQLGVGYQWPQLYALNRTQLGASTWVYPNSVSIIKDPTQSYLLVQETPTGSQYTGDNAPPNKFLNRSFPYVGAHRYNKVTMNQTWQHAYFAGLNGISFYKSNASQIIPPNSAGLGYWQVPEFFDPCLISNVFPEESFESPEATLVDPNVTTLTFIDPNLAGFTSTGGYYSFSSDSFLRTYNLQTLSEFDVVQLAGVTSDWRSQLTDQQLLLSDTSNLVTENSTYTPVPIPLASQGQVLSVKPVTTGEYGLSTGTANFTEENLLTTTDANFNSGSVGDWVAVQQCGLTVNSTFGLASPYCLEVDVVDTALPFNAIAGLFSGTHGFFLGNLETQTVEGQVGAFAVGQTDVAGSIMYTPKIPTYTWMVKVLADSVSRNATLSVLYWDFHGNPLPTETVTSPPVLENVQTSTDPIIYGQEYKQITLEVIPPANASYMGIQVAFDVTTTVASEKHYIAQAGLFLGSQSQWVSPVDYNDMRVSAVARVYLPDTDNGEYAIRLISDGAIVAEQDYILPLRNWTDLEVGYLTSPGQVNFQAQVVNKGTQETFYVSLLGPFFHPIKWELSSDNGTTWATVQGGINDPYGFIPKSTLNNQIMLKMTTLIPNTFISAFLIRPIYYQSSKTYQALIAYSPDPKVNELEYKRPPKQKGMFSLWSKLFPERLSLTYLQSH